LSFRRAAALGLSAALVLGVAGCGGDKKGPGAGSGSASGEGGSTSTSTTFPALGGLDANGVPTTIAEGSGSGKPGSGSTPTTGRQRRPGVPAPGRYMYRTGSGDRDVKALDVHEYPEREGGEIPHLETWVEPAHMTRSVVFWRPGERVLDREQEAQPNEQGELAPSAPCDFDPDLQELKFPLTVGQSWSSASSCQSGDRKKERSISAKVTATDTLTVGGEQVPVVVIERVVKEVVPLEIGPYTATSTITEFFSPVLGLLVRSTSTMEQDVAGKKGTRQFRMDLQSTRPSPTGG